MEENKNNEFENEENDTINISEDANEMAVGGNDTIKISNDAVATYAGIAVSEVQGVYGMAGTFAGITEVISGKKNLARGIKVDIDGKNAKIDVSIIVDYGARIPDVAFEIQSRVKNTVETMTGLKVSEVNVHVQGVHAVTEKNENKEENKNDNIESEDVSSEEE